MMPRSILRKEETPKSPRPDRRVTFSAKSDRRFRLPIPADDCIAPDLVFCKDSITPMCRRLAVKKEEGRRLGNLLKKRNVWTIGDFAGLSPSVIKQVPFIKEPKLENVHDFLTSYEPVSNIFTVEYHLEILVQ
uniref:Mitochondrial transcription termination factor family protein n=1 Tax=Bursaphelenchus xylophilus TaxID=6326 RepID=A0A1I7SIS7_BURXY